MGTILVTNTNPNKPITLHAHDGDSITILPKAENIKIDEKFNWNIPRQIRVNNGPLVTQNQPLEEVSNVSEVLQKLQARRANNEPVVPKQKYYGKRVVITQDNQQEATVDNVEHLGSDGPIEDKPKTASDPTKHTVGKGSNPTLTIGGPAKVP